MSNESTKDKETNESKESASKPTITIAEKPSGSTESKPTITIAEKDGSK